MKQNFLLGCYLVVEVVDSGAGSSLDLVVAEVEASLGNLGRLGFVVVGVEAS